MNALRRVLESNRIQASAPCRIDMGGTLDISTFYLPLNHLNPCTFNIAIALRTRVRLYPHVENRVRISSKGFEPSDYPLDAAPFAHPLGLMFAAAAYFRAGGVAIEIESESPPRSALGGSSVAAVALVAGLSKAYELGGIGKQLTGNQTAMLAHFLEAGVAGVPCGTQDQLAAVFGGVNAWYWRAEKGFPQFRKETVVSKKAAKKLEKQLLAAYCGIPHESKNINLIWVNRFLAGSNRDLWHDIIACTHGFIDAVRSGNTEDAVYHMNRETDIRRMLTPDVVDEYGAKLIASARAYQCGARFTGAGGGGCIWAFGTPDRILQLKPHWEFILAGREDARILCSDIDTAGLKVSLD